MKTTRILRCFYVFLTPIFWSCFSGFGSAAPIRSPELSHLFSGSNKVWNVTPETFIKIQGNNGFTWLSENQRDRLQSTHSTLRFLGIQVVEATTYFADSHLSKMVLSFYNRGDMGWVEQEDFKNFLHSVSNALSNWVGEGPSRKIAKRRTSNIRLHRLTWEREHTKMDLEWSITKKHEVNGNTIPFRSEFIRLKLSPSETSHGQKSVQANDSFSDEFAISYSLAKSKVSKNEKGDIYLRGIPMVNQGQKNYCATATVSRILGYYGRDIDQHEIAQMVETSHLGTNPEIMLNTLKKLAYKLGVRIRIHQDFVFEDLVKRRDIYNRLARREGKEELPLYRNAPLAYYYQKMDKGLLFEMLTKPSALKRFFREVKQHIQIGIPLAWSVMLGVVSEDQAIPQNVGGHMRLITGYNPSNKEIIYTDSWGPGHEFKRLSLKNAVTMTLGLYTIEPRSRRF